jgi:hypothetical protein
MGWQCDRDWRKPGNGWLRPGLSSTQGIFVRWAEAEERLQQKLDELIAEKKAQRDGRLPPPAKHLWPATGEPQPDGARAAPVRVSGSCPTAEQAEQPRKVQP